jgi:hypothetical protein
MDTQKPKPPVPKHVHAGQRIYIKPVLSAYDLFVAGFSNRFVWRCPSREIKQLYKTYLSGNHLEIGPGTGMFPACCATAAHTSMITLVDLNASCLKKSARRLSRYNVTSYRCNILEPFFPDRAPFNSASLNYVLHCLPGTMHDKAVVFDNIQPLLAPGAVLFGSTILGYGARHSLLARVFLRVYNTIGVFANASDSLASLHDTLAERFRTVTVTPLGSVGLFFCRSDTI